MIRLAGKNKGSFESQLDEAAKGKEFVQIDCTSDNPDEVMREGLSPFYIGPVECYDGLQSQTFELAWQCAKVYPSRADAAGEPTERYFQWRDLNWGKVYPRDFPDKRAIRHPERPDDKSSDCLYARWKVDGEFQKLDYIPARKAIYIPLYAKAVVKTEAFRRLVELRDSGKNLMLIDFDGYNIHHSKYNFTYNDAIHCPILKMGHGFVLAMLLEGVIKVDENGNVTYADGLMDDPHKDYSPDLRKLTDEQKLDRAASCAGVTVEELQTLSESDRKMLKRAYSREACKARGIARAAWVRLPLSEKLRVARLEEQTHEPVSVMKETGQEEITTSTEFDSFWSEFVGWWGLDEDSEEEALRLKQGKAGYTLKCCWNEGTLLVAMIAPWPEEWDYVQLYRGMFGWGDIGEGFYSRGLRKKVAKLLLDEIIRRKKWLQENPGADVQRDRELQEERAKIQDAIQKIENDIASLEEKKVEMAKEDYDKERNRLEKSLIGAKREYDMVSHQWFAKYRWMRNRMAEFGEGDMRLYVKGVNKLWSTPIHCQWALSDMRRD